MARVFISHSSRDGEAARWVADWLGQNGFEAPFLDFDKHSGIPPGADWERTLYQAIATSQALIIVQSAHWSASKWCFAEFTQARALGKPIFQLVGVPAAEVAPDPGPVAPISADLQQLDLRDDRAGSLAALAAALSELALGDRGGFAWDSSRPPYPGLLCFDQEDAAIFFGRDQEIRRLIEQLQVLRIHGGGRLVTLLGASGSGKSSLVRAGLLPRLARGGRHWLPLLPFRPQGSPCQGLAQVLSLSLPQPRDWRLLHRQLWEAETSDSLPALLDALAADLRMAQQAPEAQILITVDQAEELFAEAEAADVRCFFSILSSALQSPFFQAVITLRSDFLGSLQAAEGLVVPLQEVSLPPLPIERMAESITGPAQVAGVRVEDAFVQAAIRDARTDDALPLLAFALREIYDNCSRDKLLSLADYESLGDPASGLSPLDNAVRRAADGVVQRCRPSEAELQALRDAFVPALVRVNDQDDFTRRPARWDELPTLALPLLRSLVEARLLTVEQRGKERWVEVAHEALLRKWPLLRQWLEDAREFLVGSQRLEPELRDWQKAPSGQKSASLLSGIKLSRAESWLADRPQQIAPELRDFITASLEHQQQLARRQRNARQQIVAGLSALTLVASGAWFWGFLQNRAAFEAQTRQFQSVHLSMLEIDPLQSLVHGLATMARLKGNLNEALPLAISLDHAADTNRFRGAWASGQDEVWSLAQTPSGRTISGGRDGTLRFWSARGEPDPVPIRTDHASGVRGIVAITDQEWWTAGDDGRLQHWLAGRRNGPPIDSRHGSIQTLVRTAEGYLLSAGTDGFLRLWDSSSGKSLAAPLPTSHLEVWSVAILPNGDWLTGGREGRLQRWRGGKPRGLPRPSGQGAVSALLALPSGEIISGGDDGTLRHWSRNGQLLQWIRTHHSSIFTLLRRQDGSILSGGSERLSGAHANELRVWHPGMPRSLRTIQPGQIESLSLVQLCTGDLISGGSDGFLYHWRSRRLLGNPIRTPHRRVYALAVQPSGDLVSGGDDGTFQIWRDGLAVARHPTRQGGVTSLLSVPDGSLLIGGRDGSIQHWRAQAAGMVRASQFQTRHGAVWAIARLANGDLLSGGDDGFLRRWRQGRLLGAPIKTSHTTVVSLVVRRNGDWVSGGSGGDIQVWRHGKPLGDYFQVASGSVWSLLEGRGGELMSANGDGTLFFYPSTQQAIARACRQLQAIGTSLKRREPAEQEALSLCAASTSPRSGAAIQ